MKRRSVFPKLFSRVCLASLTTIFFLAQSASADIFEYVFDGAGGEGILAISQPGDTGTGSGGTLSRMLFDTDTNELFIDIGWGSANGFNDLTSNVSLLNIHGPTADDAPDNYGQSAGGLLTLNGIDPNPVSGGFSGTVVIPDDNVLDLMAGRLYLHIHTDNNGGGEARGYFINTNAIPEPGSAGLIAIAGAVLLRFRRKR